MITDRTAATHAATPVTLDGYRLAARGLLPRDIFDYVDTGAADEITCRANRRDLRRLALLPLCLRDVSAPRFGMNVLGRRFGAPIGFSPTAFQRLVHPDGELATARGARALGLPMIVSAMASVTLEQIAAESGHDDLWLQIYFFKDRQQTRALIERAARAGYQAIVVTLGCPAPGKRDRNIRNAFQLPETVFAANFGRSGRVSVNHPIDAVAGAELDPSATWDDVAWLRGITTLPLIAKGLMNPHDVPPALDLQLSGIVVSNHGGRQLDSSASTISVLPRMTEAVAGRFPVFVDSGFRRGTDVLKALALGADGVFLGRPVLWALAVGGEAGVVAAISLLVDELALAMQLAGTPTVEAARRAAPHLLRWD
jgi:isopentenyl diphosphate isomerase/L-lactate dehydrogenase-like FMN-dependent dehydrogenase